MCALILSLVSLESNTSLSKLSCGVSKAWHRYGLEQFSTVASEYVTEIFLWYWLDEEEKPVTHFWNDVDDIFNTDTFQSLNRVRVGCLYKDSKSRLCDSNNFHSSEFPALLPRLCKNGVLTW